MVTRHLLCESEYYLWYPIVGSTYYTLRRRRVVFFTRRLRRVPPGVDTSGGSSLPSINGAPGRIA